MNREYERLAGRPRHEILGRFDPSLFPAAVAQLFRSQDEQVAARGEPIEFQETIPLSDGVHTFITSKFPMRSPAGALLGIAGVCTDITELKRVQEGLDHAQAELVKQARLAALGELAAVIAHEVRNPLGVVFNSLASLRRTVPADARTKELLDILSAEADRLNRIVGSLLTLARPAKASVAPTSLETLAASAIEAARTLADPNAEVVLEAARALPPALVDEQLVWQALNNLVCNAIQAPGRRGPVKVAIVLDERPPARLRFEVVDDGEGVPPDLAERIFAPFFTTRAAGTGLGLAVVRRVAEAHLGSATVRPTPGGGATFVLELPFCATTRTS